MDRNGTSLHDDMATATEHAHQASGQSIFWALAAIGLNAMLQPSFSGHMWSGNSFEDSLWPHRSSPVVCIVDAVLEILSMRAAPTDHDEVPESATPATRGAITLRLAIFCIGVLPQAIKLFSMRGILLTQLLAAALLAPSMLSMARCIRSATPSRQIATDAARVKHMLQKAYPSFDLFMEIFAGPLSGLQVVTHLAIVLYVWCDKGPAVKIPLPQDVSNSIRWASLVIGVVWVILLPLFFTVAIGKSRVWTVVATSTMACFLVLGSKVWYTSPTGARGYLDQLKDACFTVAALGIVSFGLAYGLHAAASVLTRRKQRDTEQGPDQQHASIKLDEVDEVDVDRTAESSTNAASSIIYAHSGTQTEESQAISLTLSAVKFDYGSADLSEVAVEPPTLPSASKVQRAPEPDDLELEPWMWLAIYWSATLFLPSLSADSDTPVRSKDRGTQTVPEAGENKDQVTNSEDKEDTHVHGPICLAVRFPFWLAYWVGPLYLSILTLHRPAKESTVEAARPFPFKIKPLPRPTPWKIALLYVPWFFLRYLSAWKQQYSQAFGGMASAAAVYDGDVVWIAFAIVNFVTAAVVYLVAFDGEGTSSPRWLKVLG